MSLSSFLSSLFFKSLPMESSSDWVSFPFSLLTAHIHEREKVVWQESDWPSGHACKRIALKPTFSFIRIWVLWKERSKGNEKKSNNEKKDFPTILKEIKWWIVDRKSLFNCFSLSFYINERRKRKQSLPLDEQKERKISSSAMIDRFLFHNKRKEIKDGICGLIISSLSLVSLGPS